MPWISLCMIVKNEEANLPECLRTVRDLVDEIVVVDTGSTDHTREVAAGFGAHTFDFPWRDDFSAARNESLHHAHGEWVLCLDADDRLDEANRQKLQHLYGKLTGRAAYTMLTVGDDPIGRQGVPMIRLFKNGPGIGWERRVHEQVAPILLRQGYALRSTNIQVRHLGYHPQELLQRKRERNLRLLLLDLSENPNSVATLLHLGITYAQLSRFAEAIAPLERALPAVEPRSQETRFAYVCLVGSLMALGQDLRALEMCRRALQCYPEDAEFKAGEQILLANLRRFNVSPW